MHLLGLPTPASGPLGDLLRLDPRAYLERWPLGRPLAFLTFVLFATYLGLLYAGAGGWWAIHRREITAWDFCAWGIFCYLALVSAGPEAYHRFRVPLAPILCLYSASAISALVISRRPEPRRDGDDEGRAQGRTPAPRRRSA